MKKKVKKKRGKKFVWIIILIILVFVILVTAIPIYLNSLGKQEKQSEAGSECKGDLDCIKIQVTCCSCNMGGEEVCVPASNISYYQQKLKDCPDKLMCIALYNCKIKSCACVKGKCEAVPIG